MAGFHLAQVNVARLVAPIESPRIAGFVARLDEINALAEAAPGFVWRLKDDVTNNATAVPMYDHDDRIIVNMSVWASIEALRAFTYSGAHLEVYKQRRDWTVQALNVIPGISCRSPEGAFYLYVNCSGLIGRTTPRGSKLATDTDVVLYLLESEGVALVAGEAYGLSPYFRLSIATSLENLQEGCKRIARAVAALD